MPCAERVYGAIAATLVLVLSGGARAEYEASCFGVENYGQQVDGLCCETCSDLEHSVDDAEHVHDALQQHGYEQHEVWGNEAVDPADWTDGDIMYPWGNDRSDPYGTDFSDVIFYSGHGTRNCESGNYSSHIHMGDHHAGQACHVYLGDHVYLGNDGGDANILILAGCQTMQACVFEHYGYESMMGGSQFNIVNGFHGISYDNSDNTNRYANYVATTSQEGLGDDWVDWATDLHFWAWEDPDQCGTTMVRASSKSAANDQYNHGGFLDFRDTTPYHYSYYYWWCGGCNPASGDALPEC